MQGKHYTHHDNKPRNEYKGHHDSRLEAGSIERDKITLTTRYSRELPW
jgi:hypothetical protein